MWVSPFRDLRINGYLLLPEAFRSLSRLSSALSAKASALCPFCLTFRFRPPSVRDGGLILIADKFLYRCLPILRVTQVSAQPDLKSCWKLASIRLLGFGCICGAAATEGRMSRSALTLPLPYLVTLRFYQGYLIDSIKSHVCSFQGTYNGLCDLRLWLRFISLWA